MQIGLLRAPTNALENPNLHEMVVLVDLSELSAPGPFDAKQVRLILIPVLNKSTFNADFMAKTRLSAEF